jgi:predicted DNA-binding transcriptional regulator AlpA
MNLPSKPGTIDTLHHPKTAAAFLNMSVSWLAKSRVRGDGPRFVKVGRAVRYLESALRDYIRTRTRGSTTERSFVGVRPRTRLQRLRSPELCGIIVHPNTSLYMK